MGFVKVASKKAVPAGEMKLVEANGNAFLGANVADEYYAIGNKCMHKGCKLSNGTLERDMVRCPCHGSKFNVKTGEAMNGPANQTGTKIHVEGGHRSDFRRCLITLSIFCRSDDCE